MLRQPLLTNLKKRKHKRYDFYYLTYGQIIKKRRLELKKTQEDVACSICSNTYISKAENNQVVIGDDQLNLIMERLDIPEQAFANPEKLLYYLEKVIEYYYYRDVLQYQKMIEKIEGFHFHALVQLIKFGYYILIKDFNRSKDIYNQLLDYLNSLDDLAFSVFLLFSADLSLKTNDLQLAKFLIDSFYVLHTDYDELNAMYLYSKFRIYGRLDLPRQSMAAYHELLPKVMDTGNHILIHEMMLCKALFDEMYDGNNKIKYLKRLIKHVDSDIADEFLIVKAYQSDHPEEYIDLMKNQNNDKFLFAQYLLAKHYQSNHDEEKYNYTIHMIETLSDQLSYDIDFHHLLTLDKQKQWVFYKEYLINPCLKKAKKDQNIFMMRHVSQKIVDVLENHNRYKDALNYYSQSEKKIDKIQNS